MESVTAPDRVLLVDWAGSRSRPASRMIRGINRFMECLHECTAFFYPNSLFQSEETLIQQLERLRLVRGWDQQRDIVFAAAIAYHADGHRRERSKEFA